MMTDIMNQLGLPGESRGERLMLKYRGFLRKKRCRVSNCVGCGSVVAGRGSRKKQPQRQVAYQQSYEYFVSKCFSLAHDLALVSVPQDCWFLPFDKNSPNLAMNNKW